NHTEPRQDFTAPPSPPNVKFLQHETNLEEHNMNKILTALLIAAALSSATASAEDTLRVTMQNGKQRVDFSLNGNDKCVLIDDKITCAPTKQATALSH